MSAADIKIATTNSNALAAAVLDEDDLSNNEKKTDEGSSFCTLPSLKELQLSSSNNESQHIVPLENSVQNVRHVPENEDEYSHTLINRDYTELPKNHASQGGVDNHSVIESPGLSLLQLTAAASSPPPHNYRHSRAYRHFKNPPQPHMCIRTTTEGCEEVFINVLSWTRIVIPQEPSDPIPLYGGMRVPPGSLRSPPIVFAVMANPEVLKDSGRHSKDPEERRAMIELMCDFVEAMNPGVKLVRNALILKDRDISGELKDVWNAVQAQRDREREEQILLQRQQHQQHFHNVTNASTNESLASSLTSANNSDNLTATTQQIFFKSLHSGTADDNVLMTADGETLPRSRKVTHEVQNDNNASNIDVEIEIDMTKINNCQMSALLGENLDNKMSVFGGEQSEECNTKQQNNQYILTNNALINGNNIKDFLEIERSCKTDISGQLNAVNCEKDLQKQPPLLANGSADNCYDTEVLNASTISAATSTPNAATSIPVQNPPSAPTPAAQQVPTKKEKLGGFLPNGCIFPRFTKNNKHKDKDKDKESKTKDKEKNPLLSALKKSKDKKSNATTAASATDTAANRVEKITSSNSKTTTNYSSNRSSNKQHKNCLQQLECGVQKLELSNHHNHIHIEETNINNSAATIANNTSATSKNTTNATNNTGGVSVH